MAKISVKKMVGFTLAICLALMACTPADEDPLTSEQVQSRWHNSQGAVYMDQHNYTRGRAEFEQALTIDAEFATAHANLGIALYSLGKFDSARAQLLTCLRLAPQHLHANYTLGLIDHALGGNYERALDAFSTVADADGEDPLVQYYLGRTLSKLGRADESLRAYGRAIELDPNFLSAHYARAHELRQLQRIDQWREALTVFDRLSRAGFEGVSTTYQGQGKYAEAQAEGTSGPRRDDRSAPIEFADALQIQSLHTIQSSVDIDQDGQSELLGVDETGALRLVTFTDGAWQPSDAWQWPAGTASTCAPLIGDVDDDGDTDLVVSIPSARLLRQQDGTFSVENLDLDGVAHAFGDIDHDGDHDLLSFGAHLLLASSDGAGAFVDMTETALAPSLAAPTSAIFTDSDNDRDVDLIAAGATMAVFTNNRDGTLSDVGADRLSEQMPGAIRDLAVADIRPDGYLDLITRSADTLYVSSNDAGKRYTVVQRLPVGQVTAMTTADLDNDGDLDLVLAGAQGLQVALSVQGLLQLQGEGRGEPGSHIFAEDLNTDGRIDVVTGHSIHLNQTQGTGHWVRIGLEGLNSVGDGYGAKVEVHTKTGLQKRELRGGGGDSRVLHVGMGEADSVEFIRILWPSGVRQSELARGGDQTLRFKELNRKGTSCPILYAWDGSRYRFVSDFLGGAIIGYLTEPGQYYTPDTDEYVAIPHLAPRQGRYEFQVGNQLEEILYLDAAELIAVDHPPGTRLYPNERLQSSPPYPENHPYALADLRPAHRVVDHADRDVTASLLAVDDVWYTDFGHRPIHGYAEPYSLELDFGDLSNWAHPVLVAHGWVDYAHSTSNWAAAQRQLDLMPPRLEVADADGVWRLLSDDMGTPAGLPKDMVFDLSGRLGEQLEHVRLRVTTSMSIYWDQFQIGNSVGTVEQQRSSFSAADLHWRGYPVHESIHGTFAFRYDYDQLTTQAPWGTHGGDFTGFGEVSPLLQRVDDRYVIMFHGDELTLSVDADQFRPLPEGWQRSFLFYADGFGKDMDFHSAHSLTVEPLPFHGMKRYPYGPQETYPHSPEHISYRLDYNTRRVQGYYE
ncbi:MAG: tetratricopeptide repeat protein [Gemmatimonadetes bacterium]|nr:tetratricopeptide repeat protein [Gemmatimonadota bacterium]MBT5144143.1 tetratricopeptide repeat protein [Gemmatimonadota bacterium]MBT5586615.1 tetratricopeptide repeat protein [Gemmatimonadota bacterium]MBT5964451.1 tetratricopeptide repeat protein [Gemmatimonadota bacterium]MBT6626495.1 tetratricopeptide repeat protein [Gemmatimonadota bacterium]